MFCTFSKYLYLNSLQKSQGFSQMPLSENRRSMTLLIVDFHNTLISNILRLFDFSQIDITFSQFGTLAKIGVIHPLIIRAFQSTKILVFLKRIKKRHLFIHLRKFHAPADCKLKIKTLIFITLQFFIFSQIVSHCLPASKVWSFAIWPPHLHPCYGLNHEENGWLQMTMIFCLTRCMKLG